MSKQFLPSMAKGFDSEKLELYIGDGFEFLKNHRNEFDVIITDSSDPEGIFTLALSSITHILKLFNFEGPAQSLFQESYYDLLKNALRPNGIICCQGFILF